MKLLANTKYFIISKAFYEITNSSYLSWWAMRRNECHYIPIDDEKLKSIVEKVSCFVQWHTSDDLIQIPASIKYTEEKSIEFHYYGRLTMKKWIWSSSEGGKNRFFIQFNQNVTLWQSKLLLLLLKQHIICHRRSYVIVCTIWFNIVHIL